MQYITSTTQNTIRPNFTKKSSTILMLVINFFIFFTIWIEDSFQFRWLKKRYRGRQCGIKFLMFNHLKWNLSMNFILDVWTSKNLLQHSLSWNPTSQPSKLKLVQSYFSVTTVLWTVIYMVSLYLGPVIYCISSGKYPDAESTLIKIRTLVVAPLCEEIIFRKIILTLLLSAYDTKKAILLALASFSLRKWTFDIFI